MSATMLADPVRETQARGRAVGTGLWAFIGVASTLFALFITAYAMRMLDAPDWTPIVLPAQLWLSTALLVGGSVLMQRAARAARGGQPARARVLMAAGGVAAMAFLGAQLWAWQVLIDAQVVLAAHPAASFFYLLTAMHGLHVIGGLVAWSVAMPAARPQAHDAAAAVATAWRIALTARYWHFLLLLWVGLYAALAGLEPELVRAICGRA
jgi:cytochrome c oxidase subunit 3